MHKRGIGLIVFAASLTMAFLAAEVSLRVLSRFWLHVFDVEMWRYARLIKVLSPVPGVVEEQKPNAETHLMGVRVRTDEHGFRRADPVTERSRRPNRRVAVAVGDSLTLGWGVPEGQTFPDQLENLLSARCSDAGGSAVTVYNGGIGNCNTAMELARYRRRIRPNLRPDWVILGFCFNDAEPDAVPNTNPVLWHSALLSLGYSRFLKLWDSGIRNYRDYYVGLYRDGLPGWERAKQALREFGALLRADHVPATLILMPELHDPHDRSIAEAFSRVAAIAGSSGFEVIDPTGDFPPGSGERYWVSPEDAHPNAAAQAIYAHALTRSRFACSRENRSPD